MNGACRFVIQAPDTDKHRLTKTFKAYIDAAKQDLYLTTGSIMFRHPNHSKREKKRDTWNKKLFDSVFAAANRGVSVDLIANGIDGGYGELSSKLRGVAQRKRAKGKYGQEKFWEWLAHSADKSAAKGNYPYLYEIQKRKNMNAWAIFQYMHSKLIYMDRTTIMIGSYNLEEWSADKSHEVAVLCQDKTLNKQVDYGFVSDMVNSVPVTMEYQDLLLSEIDDLEEREKVLRHIRPNFKPGRTNF